MTQPTAYFPGFSFTGFQASHPSDPLPGAQVDAELFNVAIFAAQVAANLEMIQRDDGALANQVVTPESLSQEVINLIGGFEVRGAWLTATAYAVGDVVSSGGATYVCAVAHTAGVFATDLAAGKWVLIATTGSSSAAFFEPTGSSAPTNGMYLPVANTVGFSVRSGLDVLRLTAPLSAINYFLMTASAAGNAVSLSAQGGDANVDLTLVPKGTGGVNVPAVNVTGSNIPAVGMYLSTADTLALTARSLIAFSLTNPASAVNSFLASGAATGGVPFIAVQGSDTNIGMNVRTQGTGGFGFFTNGGAQQQVEILHVASAVNRVSLSGGIAGAGVNVAAVGASTDIDVNITPKGAGYSVLNNPKMASVNTGQIGGFRNGIINGDFSIWQEGTTYSPSAGVVSYTADRWCVLRNVSASVTVTRAAGDGATQYAPQITRTVADTTLNPILFGQPFTTADSYRYRGKKCTIRFKAIAGGNYSPTSGNLNVKVQTGTGTDQNNLSGYTGNTNVIDTNVTLTGSWQTFTVTSAAAVGASITEIGALFTMTPTGTAGLNDWFRVTEVELVEGEVGSTYFERLDFNTMLARCEPFFEKSFPYATAPAQNAGNTTATYVVQAVGASSSSAFGGVSFKTRKRTTPSVTLYNPSAANAQIRNTTNSSDWSASAAGAISETGFQIGGTTAAGSVASNGAAVHWAARAEIF